LAAEVLARYPRLDMLVNNAGAVYGGRQLTTDGIELTWAVNHLAPLLLTTLLLDRLKESAPARIITTASEAHQGTYIPFSDLNAERSYRSFGRYCETKLANILFTSELARRLEGTGVTANCFHPGLVATGFNRNNGLLMDLGMTILKPVSRSPQKGADTLVWLATSPDVARMATRRGLCCSGAGVARSGKPWSEMDLSDLQPSLDYVDTFAEAASFLCRDEDEVRQKARMLGP
jgi:NAD(P)-dependent dehydrogenase (short-subunit alcohol dehydrogenase family)